MANKKTLIDEELEIREEEDDVSGDEVFKKREKKGKTKEQKEKERRAIFWTLIIVTIISLIFWMIPMIKGGTVFDTKEIDFEDNTAKRNFIEYSL